MMVLLLGEPDGEFCLRQEFVSNVARLGITHVALVRDEQAAGVVLEGWLFDPAHSGDAAAAAFGAAPGARALHPVVHLAVSTAVPQGGGDG